MKRIIAIEVEDDGSIFKFRSGNIVETYNEGYKSHKFITIDVYNCKILSTYEWTYEDSLNHFLRKNR